MPVLAGGFVALSVEQKLEPLKAIEYKFLLKLANCEGHQAHISALSPNLKTPVAKRDRICQSLAEKGLVTYRSEIFRFTLSPPGRVLLSMQTTSLPVTPDELKLLRSCKGSMTPAKLGSCVPENTRQHLVKALVNRKLLKVIKMAITEVSLTSEGARRLHNEHSQRTFSASMTLNDLDAVGEKDRHL
ncbi:MAG: hypothetical protein AAFN12_16835 [Cyanobacteria bacterium J06560_2]